MTDLIKAKARGTQAKSLLDAWGNRFEELKQEYKNQFAATGPNDHELREMLWCRLQVVDDVMSALVTDIVNGRMADDKLNRT